MKIINATWEKRNLGLDVIEIEFEPNDNVKSINNLHGLKADYFVVKLPIKNLLLAHEIEDDGFRFMETQFNLSLDLTKDIKGPSYLKKISEKVTYREINNQRSFEEILDRIDEKMFDTDRVSLDYILPKNTILKRYKGWIKDEFAKNSIICELLRGKASIGFFLLKKRNAETMDSILAGIFSKYKKLGLGFAVIEKHVEFSRKNNFKKVVTRVSSNNLVSLKMHLELGYEIKGLNYVFRKINFKK